MIWTGKREKYSLQEIEDRFYFEEETFQTFRGAGILLLLC